MNSKTVRPYLTCVVASAVLAGCGGGGTNGNPPLTSVNPLTSGVLEFAVGTANLYGTAVGLNVVSTYRQSSGVSNVLLDTPTIRGPFTLPAAGTVGNGIDAYSTLPSGPSVEEVAAGGEITGTSQNIHLGTPACDSTTPCSDPSGSGGNVTVAPNTSTFGQSGGVFTDGISPGNSTTSGTAASYVPYLEPLYDATANAFVPFGGPPAFDPDKDGLGLRDGSFNLGAGVVGIPEGISTFEGVTARAGSYSLSLQVPTGNNNGTETYGTVSAKASLNSLTPLGTITAPTLALDGNGGGTFTIAALPAGVTEEYVQIVDFGALDASGDSLPNCQGAAGPENGSADAVYYTILVKAAGTYSLPDMDGPNTNTSGGTANVTPSESICTAAKNASFTNGSSATSVGDTYTVQAIGTDYPLYEATYPITSSQSPTLTGANGQSDITISAQAAPVTSLAIIRAHERSAARTFSVRTLRH